MPFLLSAGMVRPGVASLSAAPAAKDRRRSRLAPVVTPLEERQLLTTPTLISVSASAANLVFGQAEILTATVVANPPGANAPTGGTVTFSNGTTVLGTATLSNGTASLSTVLPAGTYSVTASYGGTATYGGSTSTTSAGDIFNLAGNGAFGNTVTIARHVAATSAELANPFGVAVGPAGTIYIADTFNNEIDSVNPNTGVIKVIAGNGTSGDVDGSALNAEFADPRGLAFDARLNPLFIADRDNNVIREVNLATGRSARSRAPARTATAAPTSRPRPPRSHPHGRGGRPDRAEPVHRRHVQQRGPRGQPADRHHHHDRGHRHGRLQRRRRAGHVRRAVRPLRRGRR